MKRETIVADALTMDCDEGWNFAGKVMSRGFERKRVKSRVASFVFGRGNDPSTNERANDA